MSLKRQLQHRSKLRAWPVDILQRLLRAISLFQTRASRQLLRKTRMLVPQIRLKPRRFGPRASKIPAVASRRSSHQFHLSRPTISRRRRSSEELHPRKSLRYSWHCSSKRKKLPICRRRSMIVRQLDLRASSPLIRVRRLTILVEGAIRHTTNRSFAILRNSGTTQEVQ